MNLKSDNPNPYCHTMTKGQVTSQWLDGQIVPQPFPIHSPHRISNIIYTNSAMEIYELEI